MVCVCITKTPKRSAPNNKIVYSKTVQYTLSECVLRYALRTIIAAAASASAAAVATRSFDTLIFYTSLSIFHSSPSLFLALHLRNVNSSACFHFTRASNCCCVALCAAMRLLLLLLFSSSFFCLVLPVFCSSSSLCYALNLDPTAKQPNKKRISLTRHIL